MSTILDVAKLSGVSKSTVSRVLNNGYVKPETRKAIEDAIKKLNYSPSYFAQGIRTGKTQVIAFLIPEYSNVFYNEMFAGVEEVAMKNGYMVIICNTNSDFNREKTYVDALLKRNVDGIIYNTYVKNRKSIDLFVNLSEQLPVVFMDHVFAEYNNISYVVTDGFESSRQAVRYLYNKGRRNIAYIQVPPTISVVQHRFEGYLEGLKDCELNFDPKLVYQYSDVDFDVTKPDIGKQGAEYLLKLDRKPDALMATIDLIAIGAMKHFIKSGYRVPQDISVIGYDNISLCEQVEPSLTTIAQPTHDMGKQAANILLDKIHGVSTVNDKIIFEGKLIVRESTE